MLSWILKAHSGLRSLLVSVITFNCLFNLLTNNSQANRSSNMFDDLSDLTEDMPMSVANELMAYLQEDYEKVADVIEWWKRKMSVYPCLAQMALDYQNVPG
jgi:hAT family C-terminal dimerisation region